MDAAERPGHYVPQPSSSGEPLDKIQRLGGVVGFFGRARLNLGPREAIQIRSQRAMFWLKKCRVVHDLLVLSPAHSLSCIL